jgi:hypothetical protein
MLKIYQAVLMPGRQKDMNNQKILYLIIAILVVTNVATLGYFFGAGSYRGFMGLGMMGRGHMMWPGENWEEMAEHMREEHSEIGSWEEMIEHMQEEHEETGEEHKEVDYNKPVAETHNKTHDFGQLTKAGGIVSTTFEIENHGRETLEIGEISTSCGCTSAEIDKTELGFNEEAELTVYFDPNFHEEPEGKFTRSVFVETNDPDLPEMQFDIFVEILE